MRQKVITISPTAADRNGIFLSARPAGAGAITLDGVFVAAGVATLPIPGHVTVYGGSNEATVVFTITGTNRYDAAISETITGVNASTVKGLKNFKTVTGVSCNTRPSAAIEVGSADEMESQVIPVGEKIDWQIVKSSGSDLSWALQYTHDNVMTLSTSEDSVNWESTGGSEPSSSGLTNSIPAGVVQAVRLVVFAFVSGTVTLTITPRLRGQG